ncbi:helix-turn-helix domain-containing protein [Priestia koreensis]|uniref:AraC family transcriptional regulator n=1 Tax=Priestia koreensis TaxID=284581 RepID=A0A0M0L4I8_9BACI|nr:helix-turn-helix domain-containing protein [Priestia koreensis]KOO45976.1 AraC family transcriptional regulator [Priestia koreensis]MCM3006509.1 helix-turn-helix domain-containing protein [Priestia koreensis]
MIAGDFEQVKYVCELIHQLHDIPIFLLNKNGEISLEQSTLYPSHPIYKSNRDFLASLFLEEQEYRLPLLKSTGRLEYFFMINLYHEDCFLGKIIGGPVVYSHLTDESVKGVLSDYQLNIHNKEAFQYYYSLPVVNRLKFIHISSSMFYMIYQQQVVCRDIKELRQNNPIQVQPPDSHISNRREHSLIHAHPSIEEKVFGCVRNGQKEDLIANLKIFPETGDVGVLSKTSHLRSEKNLGIVCIALATRAAVEGGLNSEIAYTLSDFFIQNLEEISDVFAVSPFIEKALLELTERVATTRGTKYSKPITTVQHYVLTHLYEEISLTQLSALTYLNSSYLSVLFKKEVGMSLTEYIQQSKIEEAKKLITYTNRSIMEIASLLNFHDQSHFTKVFKKITDTTPKQFQKGLLS